MVRDSATLAIKEVTTNPVDGDIWYADTVYVIKNNITLPVSSTITIRPGTNIKFDGNYQFRIDGTMIADGTADSVIAFTSIKMMCMAVIPMGMQELQHLQKGIGIMCF